MSSDFVLPFYIQETAIRGRYVQLNTSLGTAFSNHNYPFIIQQNLMELSALALLVTYCFKFDGQFTLQVTGDGPVSLMVVDVDTKGTFRTCVRYDEEKVRSLPENSVPPIQHLFGSGYLTFTIDPSDALTEKGERYQGIVALEGSTLSECMQHYFRQSEQLDTGIIVHASKEYGARGIMIQKMPSQDQHDLWVDYMMFLGTIKREEMMTRTGKELINKLFWEKGVMFDPEHPIGFLCSCSLEKVQHMLSTISKDERKKILEEQNTINIICEFCKKDYIFSEEEALNLPSDKEASEK